MQATRPANCRWNGRSTRREDRIERGGRSQGPTVTLWPSITDGSLRRAACHGGDRDRRHVQVRVWPRNAATACAWRLPARRWSSWIRLARGALATAHGPAPGRRRGRRRAAHRPAHAGRRRGRALRGQARLALGRGWCHRRVPSRQACPSARLARAPTPGSWAAHRAACRSAGKATLVLAPTAVAAGWSTPASGGADRAHPGPGARRGRALHGPLGPRRTLRAAGLPGRRYRLSADDPRYVPGAPSRSPSRPEPRLSRDVALTLGATLAGARAGRERCPDRGRARAAPRRGRVRACGGCAAAAPRWRDGSPDSVRGPTGAFSGHASRARRRPDPDRLARRLRAAHPGRAQPHAGQRQPQLTVGAAARPGPARRW